MTLPSSLVKRQNRWNERQLDGFPERSTGCLKGLTLTLIKGGIQAENFHQLWDAKPARVLSPLLVCPCPVPTESLSCHPGTKPVPASR